MLTLADGRTKLTILTTEPDNPAAVDLAELAAGLPAGDWINKPDFKMSPTSSDTVPDQPISQAGNAVTFGNSNFEASATVLRDLATTGQPEIAGDLVWGALKTKGARVWLIRREGPLEAVAWADGDEYDWAEVITDELQPSTDRGGYVKRIVPLGGQAWGTGTVVTVAS